MKSKSPSNAIISTGKELKFKKLAWAKKALQKMGPGYAIYSVNAAYYVAVDGDFRSKVTW